MSVIFDIETGPLPVEKLQQILPGPEELPHPGSFDPAAVKLGNLKDPKKIADKIEEARKSHEQKVAEFESGATHDQYWADKAAKAALSAATGEVLAIGYMGRTEIIHSCREFSEEAMLTGFWKTYQQCRISGRSMVGFNCHSFDVPFLVQRSWIVGVEVPRTIYQQGRYVDPLVIDLMRIWAGPAFGQMISLDTCCRAFGIGGKLDGISGADFHLMIRDEYNWVTAIEYLKRDLLCTHDLAVKMQVMNAN